MVRERPPMTFEEYEIKETFVEKYTRRIKENPFLSLGLLGLSGMLVAGGLRYKKLRADGMSPSIFLINLRVAAQGMVAGALALGLVAQAISENTEPKDKSTTQS
ncbi:HIG1 domain family member 1A, mitochondrial [Frankliniella occidentalis]|uniref:HIG1 domain family member 1A, mitochondrial n=1 Tax=Frankliniella occidentalis TaxID=133901 RepID=A0A6J1SCX2_FRAOC|nr:HIG1 domain family member 1A, mitochondrial [Frankliniella occidentalis]